MKRGHCKPFSIPALYLIYWLRVFQNSPNTQQKQKQVSRKSTPCFIFDVSCFLFARQDMGNKGCIGLVFTIFESNAWQDVMWSGCWPHWGCTAGVIQLCPSWSCYSISFFLFILSPTLGSCVSDCSDKSMVLMNPCSLESFYGFMKLRSKVLFTEKAVKFLDLSPPLLRENPKISVIVYLDAI